MAPVWRVSTSGEDILRHVVRPPRHGVTDGHLLEYLAMLDQDPQPEAGIVSWSAWRANSSAALVGAGGGGRD